MRIGLIGGTGAENLKFLDFKKVWQGYSKSEFLNDFDKYLPEYKDKVNHTIEKYGNMESCIHYANNGVNEVIYIPRFGEKHTVPPHKVNYRALIKLFQTLDVDFIISTTAVGSFTEAVPRGYVTVPNQLVDWSFRNISLIDDFKDGIIHPPFAEPYDNEIREKLCKIASKQEKFCESRTLVTINGPCFSTRAESFMFKNMGFDIINMTTATEAKLAREMGISYNCIAMVTDYDSWRGSDVTLEEIIETMGKTKIVMEDILRDFFQI